jgi:hydroxymethylglutaryl-CoA reductase
MVFSSRIGRFYEKSPAERVRLVQELAGLTDAEVQLLSEGDGLTLDRASAMVENVVGRYALPLGIATNFLINGRDRLVPMVIEEPSVIAAASHAAKLVRDGGGFTTASTGPVMIGQVQVLDVPDLAAAAQAVLATEAELRAEINRLHPSIVARGGGARGLEVRTFPDSPVGPMLVVHLLLDTRDAMGANAVNTVAEALAPRIEALTGGRAALRILSNLSDRRLARACCRVPASSLTRGPHPLSPSPTGRGGEGSEVVRGIVEAQALAEIDPYRAATHNKGVMNGVDAVVVATGNDWRAVEAGAHAYAARSGCYRPLTDWRQDEHGDLVGEIELPLAVGIVGGATRSHPVAQLALKILGVESAGELAEIAAAVGLAQNLGALRALVTEGIQRGHMALHARQVALAAGATGEDVARIAGQMIAEGNIREARARELLAVKE